jgi:hypothetical protein
MSTPTLTPLEMFARTAALETSLEALKGSLNFQRSIADDMPVDIQVARLVALALYGQADALFKAMRGTVAAMHMAEKQGGAEGEMELVVTDAAVNMITRRYGVEPESVAAFFLQTNSTMIPLLETLIKQAAEKLQVGQTKH